MEYDEVEIKYRKMTGHIDLMWEVGNRNSVGYFIQDIKTTNLKVGESVEERREKYPKRQNVFQIRSYCGVLQEKYKLPIVGWQLIYVDRSRPTTSIRDAYPVSEMWSSLRHTSWMKRVNRWADHYALARSYLDAKSKIERREAVEKLVETRPCRCETSYRRQMEPAFSYVEGGCPHLKTCISTELTNHDRVTYFRKAFAQS